MGTLTTTTLPSWHVPVKNLKMYLHFIPAVIRKIFSRYTWNRSGEGKTIYLTFDDGPVPEVTPKVLDILHQYNARATFFCVGDNVRKNPQLFKQVIGAGHKIGNHTFHHLNGSLTAKEEYLRNVEACTVEMKKAAGVSPELFRPPYGRIRSKQAKEILPFYEIIMWEVLSADYDQSLSPETCLRKSIRHTRSGSIVVFHDSVKAWKNLSWVLPRYLDHFAALGYSFKAL